MKKAKLKVKRFISVFLAIIFVISVAGNVNTEVKAADNRIEAAISWAVGIG